MENKIKELVLLLLLIIISCKDNYTSNSDITKAYVALQGSDKIAVIISHFL